MSSFLQAAQPKGKYVKFQNVGDSITMEITSYVKKQATEYGTNELKFWPSGDPIYEEHISGLDFNAESEDEANVVLAVSKRLMRQRIGEALQKAGASDLLPGGILTVTYVGDGPKNPKASMPPKDFSAEFQLPEPANSSWGAN